MRHCDVFNTCALQRNKWAITMFTQMERESKVVVKYNKKITKRAKVIFLYQSTSHMRKPKKKVSICMCIRKQKLNLVKFDYCNHRWLIYGYCFNSHKGKQVLVWSCRELWLVNAKIKSDLQAFFPGQCTLLNPPSLQYFLG